MLKVLRAWSRKVYGMTDKPNFVRRGPVVFVIGCTGTGKSDMGIELAEKYGGEVISADSMQIYKGLDIATNKVTREECRGVVHHMMSFVEPTSTAGYHVQQFKEKVLETIEEIRGRGKIPFIVGGTTYYVESILFDNNFVKTPETPIDGNGDLDGLSNEKLHDLLKEVDPESAALCHPNNRARVRRSIEVHRLTGRKKSDIHRLQAEKGVRLRYPSSLVLYLDASLEVLDERLDKRVVKMHTNGLREEVEQFYDQNKNGVEAGIFGVMQCIGLKEFMPYVRLPEEERRGSKGDKLFDEGCSLVQLHTRQYSRKQRRWVQSRLIRRVEGKELPSICRIDTSDPSTFLAAGTRVFEEWMGGKEFSEKEEEGVTPQTTREANTLFRCDVCAMMISGQMAYNMHIGGKKHKTALKQRARENGEGPEKKRRRVGESVENGEGAERQIEQENTGNTEGSEKRTEPESAEAGDVEARKTSPPIGTSEQR